MIKGTHKKHLLILVYVGPRKEMKHYFQKQNIIDIQKSFKQEKLGSKTSAPRWETDPQGISIGNSGRQCTKAH